MNRPTTNPYMERVKEACLLPADATEANWRGAFLGYQARRGGIQRDPRQPPSWLAGWDLAQRDLEEAGRRAGAELREGHSGDPYRRKGKVR